MTGSSKAKGMSHGPTKATEKKLLVTYKGGVYDLTQFTKDHPGGEDIIRQFANEDISETFHSPDHHKHSQAALNLLKQYRIDDLKSSSTAQGSKDGFLNLDEPLVWQMWNLKISKEEYLKQVHIPRHLNRSAQFFASPFLEIFTMTPWWVIPLVWLPISYYLFMSAELDPKYSHLAGALWLLGTVIWTLLEYTFHRFLFHMQRFLPAHSVAYTLHFLLHGVHHFLPMDKYRLVMPPLLFSALSAPVWALTRSLFPSGIQKILFSGAFVGYVCYDLMHYHFHHGTPFTGYIRAMKTYHMDHHYVDENLGFGVSSKVWDQVFGTTLPEHFALKKTTRKVRNK